MTTRVEVLPKINNLSDLWGLFRNGLQSMRALKVKDDIIETLRKNHNYTEDDPIVTDWYAMGQKI